MLEDKRILFTLTVEEFRELNKSMALENSYLYQMPAPIVKETQDIIFMEEAMALTGYKESSLYSKVCRLEIPVISSGRPLTFSRVGLLNWMKSGKPTVADMKAKEFINRPNKK